MNLDFSILGLGFIMGLLLACAPLKADAWPVLPGVYGNAAGPSLCPQGDGAADNGCSTSPGGTFIAANLFDGYTGTDYPSRPSKNIPGGDYRVGMPPTSDAGYSYTGHGFTLSGSCGTATMVDPALASTGGNNDPGCGVMPAACEWQPGSIGFPQIECDNTSDPIVIKGFNLGPVGGHLGTYIYIRNSATDCVTIAFNEMKADASTYVRNGFWSREPGTSGCLIQFANNQYGDWEDSWSEQGVGTASQSGTTLTVTACTTCSFLQGQYVDFQSVSLSNNAIYSQTTGTGGAKCPDPTCNGGVGTYTMSVSATRSSQAVTSGFQMAGGVGCNTTGNVINMYNFHWQVNGRLGTCQQRGTAGTTTNIPLIVNQFNYSQGGIYIFDISHYEMYEYIIADGNRPMTWDHIINQGNVLYFPDAVASSSITGSWFHATGAINGSMDPSYKSTYADIDTLDNVVIANNGAESSSALDNIPGTANSTYPVEITDYTATGNWIKKDATGSYSSCYSNVTPISFFTASQSGTLMTVSAFSGGQDITPGQRVWETGVKILSQASGTTGRAGTYNMETTCSVSCGSGGRRSAMDVIKAVTASDNYDLDSGAAITLPQLISAQTNLSPCTYPGMR